MQQTRFAQDPELQQQIQRPPAMAAFVVACSMLTMKNELVRYWQAFTPAAEEFNCHPKDRGWLQKTSPEAFRKPVLKTHDEYVKSSRFGDDKGLHLSLLPLPFIGNLDDADIVIFLQNPGFEASDYFVEEDPVFCNLARRNLKQQNIAGYPFIYLNPKFSWCSGFIWWEAKFRPIIEARMKDMECEYRKALKEISRRVAAVELFPYHSVNSSSLGKNWHKMPSAVKAQAFLASIAYDPQKLKLVVRSHASWMNKTDYKDENHFPKCARTRGITFNYKLEGDAGKAGRKILDRLRQAG